MKLLPLTRLCLLISLISPSFSVAQEVESEALDDQIVFPESDDMLDATVIDSLSPVAPQETRFGPPVKTDVLGLGASELELPIVVNTVTDDFSRDLSARRSRDIIDYIPGVTATEANGGTGDAFSIRGFNSLNSVFLNGIQSGGSTFDNESEALWNIERIEVLKGPAGTQGGPVSPGGYVNFVTKKPLATPHVIVDAEVGSYNYYGGYIDINGVVGKTSSGEPPVSGKVPLFDKGVVNNSGSDAGTFYRIIIGAERADSFRNGFNSDQLLVAPSVLWNYGDDSSFLLEIEYNHSNQPFDRGVFYLEGAGLEDNFAPNNFSAHEPSDYLDSHKTRVSGYWDHKINDAASFKLTGSIDYEDYYSAGARNPNLNGLYLPGTNRFSGNSTIARTYAIQEGDLVNYFLEPSIEGNFFTGAVEHTNALGGRYVGGRNQFIGSDGADTWDLNAFSPAYGTAPVALPIAAGTGGLPSGARDFLLDRSTDEYSIFYRHKADLMNDRLHLLGEVRYDWFEYEGGYVGNQRIAPLVLSGYSDENFSYRTGGVFDLTEEVSGFVGYSNAFVPQTGTLRGGGDPEALEATNIEGGLKTSLLEDRLFATFSVFEIEQSNILESDPDNLPGETFRLPLGTNTVQGAEFSVSGRVGEWVDINAGLAYLDSEISSTDDPLQDGNSFYNTPEWQGSIYARLDLGCVGLEGLSVGSGLVHVDNRPGDNSNSFTLPSYTRWDAGLFYNINDWAFRFTVENVTNERYFLGSQNNARTIAAGAPTQVGFGVRKQF